MGQPTQEAKKKTKVPTAKKRQLQNEKRRMINKSVRSSIRTKVRQFLSSLATKDKEQLEKSLQEIYAQVDKAAKKGLFNTNKAGRIKSRLTSRLHAALSA